MPARASSTPGPASAKDDRLSAQTLKATQVHVPLLGSGDIAPAGIASGIVDALNEISIASTTSTVPTAPQGT